MKAIPKMLVPACAGLFLAACADTSRPVEPVLVHTDTDAATLLAMNSYQATHVKIGARWFPRCQTFTSLGSRTDTSTACLSDAEIKAMVESQNAQQQEFLQRGGAIAGMQGS